MEPEGLLPNSQAPAICPYPEPDQSSPFLPHPNFFKVSFYYYSAIYACVFQVVSFTSGLPTKMFYAPLLSPMRAARSAHLILLVFITGIIFGEQYTSISSLLCSLLHSPITSSILGSIHEHFQIMLLPQCERDRVSYPYRTIFLLYN